VNKQQKKTRKNVKSLQQFQPQIVLKKLAVSEVYLKIQEYRKVRSELCAVTVQLLTR
jgi:hypothetical protein